MIIRSGNAYDLEKLIHVNKVEESIKSGMQQIAETRALWEDKYSGQQEVIVIEGEVDGEPMLLLALASDPEAEGVAVAKADIESGALTMEQACHQLCEQARLAKAN